MAEYCYTELCGQGMVKPELQDEHTKNMCSFIAATLVNVGVSGILEASPCPFVAIGNLQPRESDTVDEVLRKIEICGRLGIDGFIAQEDMD